MREGGWEREQKRELERECERVWEIKRAERERERE